MDLVVGACGIGGRPEDRIDDRQAMDATCVRDRGDGGVPLAEAVPLVGHRSGKSVGKEAALVIDHADHEDIGGDARAKGAPLCGEAACEGKEEEEKEFFHDEGGCGANKARIVQGKKRQIRGLVTQLGRLLP